MVYLFIRIPQSAEHPLRPHNPVSRGNMNKKRNIRIPLLPPSGRGSYLVPVDILPFAIPIMKQKGQSLVARSLHDIKSPKRKEFKLRPPSPSPPRPPPDSPNLPRNRPRKHIIPHLLLYLIQPDPLRPPLLHDLVPLADKHVLTLTPNHSQHNHSTTTTKKRGGEETHSTHSQTQFPTS